MRLNDVFTKIKEAGLKLKPSKCHLFQKEVVFLGHTVSEHGISTSPEKITAVQSWPIPENVSQLRSYLGFCSYYRKFVKNYADIAKPLTVLTGKGIEWCWSEDCQKAFDILKDQLTNAPVMAHPSPDGMFILDTDASDYGIGAVLSQIQDGEEHVIAYASRTLNKVERRYCVTRKELLAIVYFMKYFRHYLLGNEFLIRSDHQPLKWIFKLKDASGQIARWLEVLASYHFKVEYRPGKSHNNADGMSRIPCAPYDCQCEFDGLDLPCGPCKKCSKYSDLQNISLNQVKTRKNKSNAQEQSNTNRSWIDGYSASQLHHLQEKDPDIAPILAWKISSNSRPESKDVVSCSPATRNLWLIWQQLELRNNVLYKYDVSKGGYRLIIPQELRKEVLVMNHDSRMSGHLGYKKTLAKVQRQFYWYKMKEYVYSYVKRCHICQSNKRPKKKSKAPLGHIQVGAPMDCIGIDFVGPLPLTPRGNRHLLVVMDYFTKWVEVYPVPDTTATVCVEVLLNEFISRFGIPLQIHSDQGRSFESEMFQNFCRTLEIKKTRTSPRHPSCNGMVERYNATLIKMIKAYLKGKQSNWDLNIGCLLLAYRSTLHESTGFSPNMLMLGREVTLPSEFKRKQLPWVITLRRLRTNYYMLVM